MSRWRWTATSPWPPAAAPIRSSPGGPIDKIYDNCFVIRFDGDGRCREFTEWFMQRPDA